MDNQQANALAQAAHNAGLSLNQLAAFIAEVSGNLQSLAALVHQAGQVPPQTPGGQQAPTGFPQPNGQGMAPASTGGAAPGQQFNAPAPGMAPSPQQPQQPPTGAASGADAGKRKRRTKAEIAADEAAIAAGYTSHADMLAKTGGNAAVVGGTGGPGSAPGQTAPNMQPPAMGKGGPGVPPMQGVQGNVPSTPQQPAAGPSPDEAQAAFIRVITAVEQYWPGHGQGQAGIIMAKFGEGAQNVHMMTPEQRAKVISWCDYFVAEFLAGRLPKGAEQLGS